MIKIVKKIFSEPLVKFLLLGGLLYIYYINVTTTTVAPQKETIKLSKHDIAMMQKSYEQKHHRKMNAVEEKAYIMQAYYDKVLLKEAYALKLEKSDALISKRLLKEMRFILLKSAKNIEPTEKELLRYYKNNIKEYSELKRLSFSNIIFQDSNDEINATYDMLQIAEVNASKAAFFGEPVEGFNYVDNADYKTVEEKFGKYFASKLWRLKEGTWSKPIHSKLGKNIVFITKKLVGDAYSFDEVQDRVYSDFLEDNKTKIITQAYKNIAQNYTLEVQEK